MMICQDIEQTAPGLLAVQHGALLIVVVGDSAHSPVPDAREHVEARDAQGARSRASRVASPVDPTA